MASQFFLVWLFNKVPWFYNYSASGQISVPERHTVRNSGDGSRSTAPWATYLFCLALVFVLFAWIARNLTRGRIGRSWMAIRDMDIAAEIIGVPPLRHQAVRVCGDLHSTSACRRGACSSPFTSGRWSLTEAFGIDKSFLVLFMIIIGGLGSIVGSFIGAAFMVLLVPVLLKNIMVGQLRLAHRYWPQHLIQIMLLGGLIMFFLIVEPHGSGAVVAASPRKNFRLWPFPH